jgi:hypothetical protein
VVIVQNYMLHTSRQYVLNITTFTGTVIRQLHVSGLLHFIQKLIFDDFVSPALYLEQ